MIADSVSAVSGIKAALDIAKGVSALKGEVEINQAIISIQRTLLDAQESALADKQIIGELRGRLTDIERAEQSRSDRQRDMARYRLTKSPMGAYFYELRPEMAEGEVTHRLCATCYQEGRKSILHTIAAHGGGEMVMCQPCGKQILLADFQTSSSSTSHDFY